MTRVTFFIHTRQNDIETHFKLFLSIYFAFTMFTISLTVHIGGYLSGLVRTHPPVATPVGPCWA